MSKYLSYSVTGTRGDIAAFDCFIDKYGDALRTVHMFSGGNWVYFFIYRLTNQFTSNQFKIKPWFLYPNSVPEPPEVSKCPHLTN